MREGIFLAKLDFLSKALSNNANGQFVEAIRVDALVQLLIDKKLITKEELDAKYKVVREDTLNKLRASEEEKKNKSNIILPSKEIL